MNKKELNAVMARHGDTNLVLARALGVSPQTLSRKRNGTHGAQFTQNEIRRVKERYHLSPYQVDAIFFVVPAT